MTRSPSGLNKVYPKGIQYDTLFERS